MKRKSNPLDTNDPELCQWIEGEPCERNFCQRETVWNTSWCREHLARVALPPEALGRRAR